MGIPVMILILFFVHMSGVTAQKVRQYREPCNRTEQCVDHRMVCVKDEANSSMSCLCDKFHVWDENYEQCAQLLNISMLLSNLTTSNSTEVILKKAEEIFVWIIWAGVAVAVVFGLIALSCIIYGCCLYECYDLCVGDSEKTNCPPTCVNYQRTLGSAS